MAIDPKLIETERQKRRQAIVGGDDERSLVPPHPNDRGAVGVRQRGMAGGAGEGGDAIKISRQEYDAFKRQAAQIHMVYLAAEALTVMARISGIVEDFEDLRKVAGLIEEWGRGPGKEMAGRNVAEITEARYWWIIDRLSETH